MKVSRKWLQKFFDVSLPSTEVLADALMFHALEVEGVEKVGSDDVLDLKVLQRGHDCLSHRGIAKELSAILKISLAHDAFDTKSDISKKTDKVSVSIESPLCKRYVAAYIKGVKVGPSPAWLRERLEAIGQRSINNVVDATNFVMFNTGQPLHAFDAEKIKGKIVIRQAKQGDSLTLLRTTIQVKGGVTAGWNRHLYQTTNSGPLIIADDSGPIALAGIKGGNESRVTDNTKDIIIEAANFDGPIVRWASKMFNLRTDASMRFEQVLSPELAAYGMRGMIEFVLHQIGGEITGFVDVYPEPQKQTHVSVTLEKINRMLGITLTGADVADVFTRLGLPYKEERGAFEVQPPPERLDLTIAEDLVEEVGRIIGYDKIPTVPLPPFSGKVEINKNFAAAEGTREKLQTLGYSEVYTSIFAEKGERAVLNKVDSVKPFLRSNLTDGLTEALRKNIPNKDLLGLSEIKLFEIGTVWKGGKEVVMVGTVREKAKAREELLPRQINVSESIKVSGEVKLGKFAPYSKYPYIVRDIAMWTPASTKAEEVQALIKEQAGNLAVKISLFDTFEKQGRVSLAFRIIFQSFERTLTEVEVNTIMDKISAALKAQGFEIR